MMSCRFCGGDHGSEYDCRTGYGRGYGAQQTGRYDEAEKVQTNLKKKKSRNGIQVDVGAELKLRLRLKVAMPAKRNKRVSALDPFTTFLLVSLIAIAFESISYVVFGKAFAEIMFICWLLFFLVTSLIVTHRGTRRW